MVSRRKFLAVTGGGVVLAALGATGWALTRDPAQARQPWSDAGEDQADPRRRALSYAILAPNPHNRQPWLADLSVADEVTLFCDLERRLPHTDPLDRQITIGLGCFIELFAQAAAEDGFSAEMNLFPDGEPSERLDARPVARIRMVADEGTLRDPLFAAVLDRRSNKEAYDTSKAVSDAVLSDVLKAARYGSTGSTNDAQRVAALRDLGWQAMLIELSTHRTAKESIDLMRIGKAEIEANPDGIDLPGPMFEALALAGLLDRDAMLDTNSAIFRQQLPYLKEPFDTAMAFAWLSTPGNTRSDQIAAGRDHIRMNLAATLAGVDVHPVSQSLQEFEEMRSLRVAMRSALGIDEGHTLQMLMRLGYGPQTLASPRWPYETRIRSA